MKRTFAFLAAACLLAFSAQATGFARSQDFTIPAPPASATTPHPILFVTQPPVPNDALSVVTTFGNHRGEPRSAARGGDLWIRYSDGTLKNLTAAAGMGNGNGFQGASSIAVRDPSLYFDGSKAVFSMVVGAPNAANPTTVSYFWQLYEVTGFAHPADTVVITPVVNQPTNYNNLSPLYGTDDRIIFVSDMPHGGEAWLYPTLDEYNMAETNTGLWSLDPASGNLFQVDHNPSGDFSPSLDRYGRVIFTRWDHLERDQETDADVLFFNNQCHFCTFNYASEAISATRQMTNVEVFPEPRPARTDELANTNLSGHHMNEFLPWSVNEDGTRAETIDHIGRHELLFHIPAVFTDDVILVPLDPAATAANIANASGPAGSVVLADDGSMAAFVPARRAMTWQLTDAGGTPVVRERVWVTFQPGEIRVCTSCHGLNDKDQAGNSAPVNPPQALDTLIQYWKANQAASQKVYLPSISH